MTKTTHAESAEVQPMNIVDKIEDAMRDKTITQQMIHEAIPVLKAATGTAKRVLENVITRAAEQVTVRGSRHLLPLTALDKPGRN